MRYHNLPVTRQDYLNVAYLGHPRRSYRRRRKRICRRRFARPSAANPTGHITMQTGRRNRANFADITGHPRPHWAHTGLESDQSSPRAAQARKRGRSNLSGRRHAPTALGKGGDDPEPAPMWWQVGQAIGIKHASDYNAPHATA